MSGRNMHKVRVVSKSRLWRWIEGGTGWAVHGVALSPAKYRVQKDGHVIFSNDKRS